MGAGRYLYLGVKIYEELQYDHSKQTPNNEDDRKTNSDKPQNPIRKGRKPSPENGSRCPLLDQNKRSAYDLQWQPFREFIGLKAKTAFLTA